MTNSVYDLKSTNNDLLKVSVGLYNQSLDSRREAWVNIAQLPPAMKKELKTGYHVKPTQNDPQGQPLSILAQNEVNILEEHQTMLKDQAWLGRSLNQATFVPRPDRGRPANRRGGRGQGFNQNQGYQGFNQGYNQGFNPNYRGNRGRGSSRGYRGNTRGRGQFNQPQQQPFLEAQPRAKKD